MVRIHLPQLGDIFTMTDHPKEKGLISEMKVKARLIEKGYTVLEPIGDNERFDIVIIEDGEYKRVQIKTASPPQPSSNTTGSISFEVRSCGVRTRKVEREDYKGDVELFMAYYKGNDTIYEVPIEEVGTSAFTIRLKKAKNGNSKNINWHEDYKL